MKTSRQQNHGMQVKSRVKTKRKRVQKYVIYVCPSVIYSQLKYSIRIIINMLDHIKHLEKNTKTASVKCIKTIEWIVVLLGTNLVLFSPSGWPDLHRSWTGRLTLAQKTSGLQWENCFKIVFLSAMMMLREVDHNNLNDNDIGSKMTILGCILSADPPSQRDF